MDKVDELEYESLSNYFNKLRLRGETTEHELYKVVALVALNDILKDCLLSCFITEENLKAIECAIERLTGSICEIPFIKYDGSNIGVMSGDYLERETEEGDNHGIYFNIDKRV